MMRWMMLGILIATSQPAYSQVVDCEYVATGAAHVMNARQKGVPLSQTLKIIGGDALHTELVMEAYGKPQFSTPKYQERAVARFRDEWHLKCLKARS